VEETRQDSAAFARFQSGPGYDAWSKAAQDDLDSFESQARKEADRASSVAGLELKYKPSGIGAELYGVDPKIADVIRGNA
jgi:hypothetical protein